MTRRYRPQQTGMTLIELLIALSIASILMFGVGTVYVSSKRGYNIQDNLARQQENSRVERLKVFLQAGGSDGHGIGGQRGQQHRQ